MASEKRDLEQAQAVSEASGNDSMLEGSYDAEFADINESALLRKLDIRLLPAVTVLYLASFLDRSNGMRSL